MNEMVGLLEVAARVLREHPDAPAVTNVEVCHRSGHGLLVSLQLGYAAHLREITDAVASWALALDAAVQVVERKSYTEIAAYGVVDGQTVWVWDHLEPAQVVELLDRTGGSFEDGRMVFDPVALRGALAVRAVA